MKREPIRILHMIASLNIGGSQTAILNLYRTIERDKVQFDFIIDHPEETELKGEVESLGGRVFTFPTFTGINIGEIKTAWDNFFDKHSEYKVLHTHSRSYASLYLPIAKKRGLVTIAHSHSTSNGKGPLALVKDVMRLPIRRQADYLFACSREAGEWLYGKKAVREDRFRIIPNAIDSERFRFDAKRREEVRQELCLRDSFVIGHVGRLVPPKNHAFLFQIFREWLKREPNSELLLLGDGDLADSLKAEAKGLGIAEHVVFLGAKTNVPDYYQAMDAFVFPSLWEGLGIAVVEAQASGLPCVVADTVPGAADIGAGLVDFLPLDAPASEWAGKIKSRPREDTSRFVRGAGYDIKANAAAIQVFYEELCR